MVVAICFAVAALEGYDIQAFGVAAPKIVAELSLDAGQMGWAASVAMLGLVIGFAGVALLVGSFLIVNTFGILVAQRSKELALMRALGASRRQVFGGVVIEALVVGFIGSVLGIGVGVTMAFVAVVASMLGSEPAPGAGSVIAKAEAISPASSGLR